MARGRNSSGRLLSELGHLLVSAAQRQMQESERIEDGLRRVPERFDQHLDRRLGSARAVGMAAHAVDHDQQRGMLRDRDRNAILIVGAIA